MKRNWVLLLIVALMLCLLPGITPEAKAETFRTTCEHCKTFADHEITGYSRYNDDLHWVTVRCSKCGESHSFIPVGDPHSFHSGGAETPTCTTGKTCAQCGAQYGVLGHDWGAWQSRGNNSAHFRTCQREGCDAVDTESCSGDSSATCIALGTCSTCGGQYYSAHAFPARWDWRSDTDVGRDAEKHWLRCLTCTEGKTYVGAHSFVQGRSHLKSKATCVSPAVYYTNCSTCNYMGTDTYVDTWYGTDPDNHDMVHHDAKAPTCTEDGWNEYDACQREGCTYTTKVEIPALNHDYQQSIVKPTCEANGYTLYTCVRCKADYTDDIVPRRAHWYGEWTPNGDGTHSASCRREGCGHMGKVDCQKIEFVTENGNLVLCPVCGEVENGERLELMEEALAVAVNGKIPAGEMVARMKDDCLSIAFEHAGKIVAPTGLVKITLPARLLEGKTLALIATDGSETELPFEMDGEDISFTLDFTDGNHPVILIRLIQGA